MAGDEEFILIKLCKNFRLKMERLRGFILGRVEIIKNSKFSKITKKRFQSKKGL